MKAFLLGSFCGFLLVLCACGPATEKPEVRENEIRIKTNFVRASVQEVTLSNGTRCAILNGPDGKGGIDCDWENKAKPE